MKIIVTNTQLFIINIDSDMELLNNVRSFRNKYGKNKLMCVYTPNLNSAEERIFIESFATENDICLIEIPISLTCASLYNQIEHSGIVMDSECISLIPYYASESVLQLVAVATNRKIITQQTLTDLLKGDVI